MSSRWTFVVLALAACSARPAQESADGSARERFARAVDERLLDTTLYELRAQLFVAKQNTDPNDPESPLTMVPLAHDSAPGPHVLNATVYAEIGALRDVLGRDVPIRIERETVILGTRPVVIFGHFHGSSFYVPVKLFARQYGAYVDVSCTLSSCANIWSRDVLAYMKRINGIGGTGMLEAHAEGLIDFDVNKIPTG